MDNKLESKPGEGIWVALIIGVILTCIVSNLLTIVFQFGGFSFWVSLPKLPSRAVRIIDADPDNIWVGTDDGRMFTLTLICYKNDNCRKWLPVNNASDITPAHYAPIERGTSCPSSNNDLLPNNPGGKFEECIRAPYPGSEMGSVTYYALMTDGSVKYWQNGNSIIGLYFFFFISTFVLPVIVGIIISVIFAVKNVMQKTNKQKNQMLISMLFHLTTLAEWLV